MVMRIFSNKITNPPLIDNVNPELKLILTSRILLLTSSSSLLTLCAVPTLLQVQPNMSICGSFEMQSCAATARVRIAERPLDIKVSCDIRERFVGRFSSRGPTAAGLT